MALDRDRSYGVVCGEAGHAFEQDGKRFDPSGTEIAPKIIDDDDFPPLPKDVKK